MDVRSLKPGPPGRMSTSLRCEAAGCQEVKKADDMTTCIALMQLHQKNVHEARDTRQKPPKINRPTLQQGIGEDDWAAFTRRWDMFQNGTELSPNQVTAQLLACCEPELEAALFREDPTLANKTKDEVLNAMKRLTVLSVALSVRRAKLLQTRQDPGENVRQYVARLRGLANVCQWTKNGTCGERACSGAVALDYTEDIVKLVLLNGLVDEDIRKEVLGATDIDSKSLNDTVCLIDSKETASRALTTESPTVAASSYKKMAREQTSRDSPGAVQDQTEREKMRRKFRCQCGSMTPQFGRVRGKLKEFKVCLGCWKKTSQRTSKSSQPAGNGPVEALFHYIATTEISPCLREVLPHPTLPLTIAVDREAYATMKTPSPPQRSARISAVADSGAQTCLMGLQLLNKLGLSQRHLTPVSKHIFAANNEEIRILGAVFLTLSGLNRHGEELTTSTVAYVTDSTSRFYLSRAALEQLGVIGPDFPKIGATGEAGVCENSMSTDGGCRPALAECGCPSRTAPPSRPARLPMVPSLESTGNMKAWLLERYASSTFNVCPHQPLPAMAGPPMEIRVDPDIQPVVTRRPPNVPVHWQKEVSQQLQRDVALGVIERVPPNTPVTWLHSMVLTPKSDGTPRRTVDLQPLNRHSVRETHHTIPPIKQAKAIPPNTFKTVTDAWNGFHSIEIRAEDRHKTTFLTEQGRFRYCRAPMGFLASQDAYTHRYDAIIADIPRKTKCVDDTIIWDADLEEHWWRVIDYLELVGRNGVILNPEKFQFASADVEFAGFQITRTEVKPLPKYLNAIASFPRPSNITDVRAWFGLVNQVSHYGRTTDLMAPFRPLLSPKVTFKWDSDMEEAFQRSKDGIIEEIKQGVEIFDPNKRTCLNPDWSRTGVGYWLRQKHCGCDSDIPGCCTDGWRITLAGSRFLRDAEKRYAPIEGEALAVAWALEDSRFFTLGCRDLVITTDHKPLAKILGDQALDDIANPRLFRLKQRTLMWQYRITHVPGKTIPAADATSRYPSSTDQISSAADALSTIRIAANTHDDLETLVVAAARSSAESLDAVTWCRVREGTSSDDVLRLLIPLVEFGFPPSRDGLPEDLQPYWQYRDRLSLVDNVILMDQRIVVPQALRNEVLQALHAAHQGTSRMYSRALGAVFWPGITKDIECTRSRCHDCWRMTPSQSRMPPVQPCVPNRPFQAVAADFCVLRGIGYLVIVDRFSGWPHIVATKSGAKGLITTLINYFATFGVPEELSTDGGPEFTARETKSLLERWGVRHRLSSAHHPQSNGRAEVAVKSMKRLLTAHTDANGSPDTEAVTAGLLQYRNTPDPQTGMSPAQVVFGRNLRDLLPVAPGTQVFASPMVHPVWRQTWEQQEEALRLRFAKQVDDLRHNVRQLPPLVPGNRVLLQNQTGNHSKRWDRTGIVIEAKPYDQYVVKVDGSGRLTLRNRRFLRQIQDLTTAGRFPSSPGTYSQAVQNTGGLSKPGSSTCSPQASNAGSNPGPDESLAGMPSVPPEAHPAVSPPRSDNEATTSTPAEAHLTPVLPSADETAPCPTSAHPLPSSPQSRPHRNRRPPAYLRDYVTE